MSARNYDRLNCPIAKTLAVVGDQWTLMIVRDVLVGPQRFDEIQNSLGISRNLLSQRLRAMVEEGLLRRQPIAGTRRHVYQATDKCRGLRTALLAMAEWGEHWRPDVKGPRLTVRESATGAAVGVRLCRLEDGQALAPEAVSVERRVG